MRLLETLDTITKINNVFSCKGAFMHIILGFDLLRAMNGYVCPDCGAEVIDATDTPYGKAFYAQARPDLMHRPLPHRTPKST